jgi:hypothetical protein
MLPTIIFPYPYQIEVSKLRQQLDEAHLAWAREWKARQADFKIENIWAELAAECAPATWRAPGCRRWIGAGGDTSEPCSIKIRAGPA